MITISAFLMGREKQFPLSVEQALNAADLLSRVNWLLAKLNIDAVVTSGYRPPEINQVVGGANLSQHTLCKAVDILDPYGKTGTLLTQRRELLVKAGLWLESPMYTRKNVNGNIVMWSHLDTKERVNRIFNP